MVWSFDGKPLPREHGGPVRLLVPHLYFWKSAKWVTQLTLLDHDQRGFWERNGYHDLGDPWREQRYWGDWHRGPPVLRPARRAGGCPR